MRKLLVAMLLALLTLAPMRERAVAQESKTLQSTSEQKTIKDKAEFDAYMAARGLQDAKKKGAAMEEFAARYPRSTVYGDALQEAMSAYQAAGNGAKVEALAARLLKYDPRNVQALAILTFIKMNVASLTAVEEAKGLAERGLKLLANWKRAPGVSEAEFTTVRRDTAAIFYSAIGLAALYVKDYPAARRALLKTVAIHLNGFADPYRLGVAELEMNPLDAQGFWYVAKSIDMAKKQNPAAAAKIEAYATAKYKRYHGSMTGWDALLASAAAREEPPRGFAVKHAP
jgi:hypothetical protein